MNIKAEHIESLTKLGYTERESQFLYIVATHSGHFLRRQFSEFAGTARGRADHEFLSEAIKRGHVCEYSYTGLHTKRYHLYSRIVYRAIDKENSANRKAGSEAKANLKLRILDFVLDNPHEDYLEEESDKVRFFTVERGISQALLPARVYESDSASDKTLRCFADKFPLFLSKTEANPLISFTYFEDNFETSSRFASHLKSYKPLLKALDEPCKLIYVGNDASRFDRAEKQFKAMMADPDGQPYYPTLSAYFRLRKLWQEKHYEEFTDRDYVALNRGEKKFSKPEHEGLYEQWLTGKIANQDSAQSPLQNSAIFETYYLRT
jgi:hypothetical protein